MTAIKKKLEHEKKDFLKYKTLGTHEKSAVLSLKMFSK